MTNLNDIHKFLEPEKMAIAGVSRNPKKFGGAIINELKNKGFELFPVNREAEEIQGVRCYQSVLDLPADVKHLVIITPKHETAGVVKQAVEKGFDMIWIQQKSDTPEAIQMVKNAGIPLIYNKCLMMFADPVKGIHGFHLFLAKTFGIYPKMEIPSAN